MAQQLTQQDLADLKGQGFSDQEIAEALQELELEDLQRSSGAVHQSQMRDPRQFSQQSAFAVARDDNLIRWQLELNDILERAEHILRGDQPKFQDGHLIWDKNPFPKDNPLNEFGVSEIMKILSMYINRNTILSDYDKDEINYKVFDFGRRVNNFIFMRYEEIGMDTEHKRKHFEIIVGELVDLVHSAYKRALHGGERRSLREMISISQNTQTQGMMTPSGITVNAGVNPQRERSFLNPMRYISGKYK
jgi:hypothetical protein